MLNPCMHFKKKNLEINDFFCIVNFTNPSMVYHVYGLSRILFIELVINTKEYNFA